MLSAGSYTPLPESPCDVRSRGETVRRLLTWSGLLATLAFGVLVVTPTGAQASHVPDCFGQHPTNTPTPGHEVIEGTPGDDVLAGGGGYDEIRGRGGSDILCGNYGEDTIRGGSGAWDRIDGGAGNDDLGGDEFTSKIVSGERCGLITSLTWWIPLPPGDPGGNTIYGGDGHDDILGSVDADGLFGERGRDCVTGHNGDDYLSGGNGADRISGSDGQDSALGGDDYDDVFGNAGNDWLYARSTGVRVPVWPDTCAASGELAGAVVGPTELQGEGYEPVIGYNMLAGGDGHDVMIGASRSDRLHGGAQNDDLYGLGGEDVLWGESASDCLAGGPDRDELDDADHTSFNEVPHPDDIDTLWGGTSPDNLNSIDADGLDSLDGGGSFSDTCAGDPGDVKISC